MLRHSKGSIQPSDGQLMRFMQPIKSILILFPLIYLLASSSTSKTLTVATTASLLGNVAIASYKQSNLNLIRQGMASYLMLIDGMVEALPNNKRLLID